MRLKELRLQHGYTQKELAIKLNVAQNTLCNWENGNRTVDEPTLQKLADVFNVSVDYLLGRTAQTADTSIYKLFGSQLKKLRNETGLSQAALARELSVSQQTVASWEVDRSSPSPEMLSLIADVFSVSTDYLLGKTDEKKPAAETGDELKENTIRIVGRDGSYIEKTLTDEQIQALRTMLDALPDANDL